MRILFFTLFYLCCLNSLKSQSKGDTQVWIMSIIENFQDKSLNGGKVWVYYSGGPNSSEQEIWFTKLESGGFFQYEIKLQDLNQVLVKKTDFGYTLSLGCIPSKRCCAITHQVVTETGSVVKSSSDTPKYNCEIYLTRGLSEDNMPNRLKKAIIHLITLNGGKVLSDTF